MFLEICMQIYSMVFVSSRHINKQKECVTEADLLRRLTLGFNELNFNTSQQNK